jgi:cytochrome c551/c552
VAERPQVPDDPITGSSYSMPLLVWSFVLVLTLAWALYDEAYGLRPWRSYQNRFAAAYAKYLQEQIPRQRELAETISQSAEYKALSEKIEAAKAAAAPRVEEIVAEMGLIDRQLKALQEVFQTERSRVGALVYQVEIASSPGARESRQRAVEQARSRKFVISLPNAAGAVEPRPMDYNEMEAEFNRLRDRKAQLVNERARVESEVSRLSQEQRTLFSEKMTGLTAEQLEGLLRAVRRMRVEIRQFHVGEVDLVDRCQSCHVGMDTALVPPTLPLTKAALGLEASTDEPFSSHPVPELLRLHPPQRFGCSPCHGGNGRATSSVVKGHGRHKYWLWPLHYRENFEAGCQSCHAADMVLDHAPVLNRGKELFRERGCIGCHRYEGFDNEGERLLSTRQTIRQLLAERREHELEIPRITAAADRAEDNATAQRLYARADNLRVTISAIDARLEQLERLSHSLLREEKKVGPSLKEVRQKLRKEWIPVWLARTHEFRPDTKMPQFRMEPQEIQAVAAFIWQSGVEGPALQKQPQGNAARGKELFETRGCLGCHSIGEGNAKIGGDFAANLSRVGEKANYDYLVRWVHNPRERTRPYCPYEKRDLGPEDYARHGLPFVFDLEHSRCPNDGHELQVQQQTVMPSLRLTWEEARDIASFLMTQRRASATYEAAPFLDDANLKARGRELVRHYGCAGCHEIAGMEEEGRIGTELTAEGSKPIERLDFALLTHPAQRGHLPDGSESPRGKWYDHKGFFEQKLKDPASFDTGKYKPNPRDRLRMPKPNVTPEDITALTTFLLGSVDRGYGFPPEYVYQPSGPQKDIQAGWWLITKYNCMGCHRLQLGQQTSLETQKQYQGEGKEKLPPPLVGLGARVNPDWLARFLENPALSPTDTNRNGVRSYLQLRMPTFSFSDQEIRILVRFFEALSGQAQPYLPPKMEPLTPAELQVARALFTSPAAPCLRCHATGDPAHDRNATAPNFIHARERLRPAWTARWLVDPAMIIPGTSMPSGLFRREGDRWVFAGPLPPAARAYSRDHADLLVRYMLQLTPQEQRAISGRGGSAGGN